MSWLWQLVLMWLGREAKRRVVNRTERLVLLTYLRGLRAARKVTVLTLFVFLFVQVLLLAGFGALVCGVLLFESDPRRQLQILFGVCLALFALPALVLAYLLSERTWLKASGAARMIDHLEK